MIEMLLRLVTMTALVTVPFLFLAFASGRADVAAWLMLPFFSVIPILLVCALLFQPFEGLAERLDISPNIIVPIVGSLAGIVVVLLASSSRKSLFWEKALAGDLKTIGATVGVILVGALVGGAWRMSLRIVQYFGWTQ